MSDSTGSRAAWDGYPESGPNELGHTKGCRCDDCYRLTHATGSRAAEMTDFRAGYEFGYCDGQVGEYQPEKHRAARHRVRWFWLARHFGIRTTARWFCSREFRKGWRGDEADE